LAAVIAKMIKATEAAYSSRPKHFWVSTLRPHCAVLSVILGLVDVLQKPPLRLRRSYLFSDFAMVR
jgi:hypothetical protein